MERTRLHAPAAHKHACPHGMPSPPSCVQCMEDGPVAPPAPREAAAIERVFAARHDGDCPECGLPIARGHRIARLSTGRYVHEGCAKGLPWAPGSGFAPLMDEPELPRHAVDAKAVVEHGIPTCPTCRNDPESCGCVANERAEDRRAG